MFSLKIYMHNLATLEKAFDKKNAFKYLEYIAN